MKMTARVRKILANYESDNPGTKGNLARILMHGRLGGTGRLLILPVDQGVEHGPARSFAPNPPAYDPHYHFQLAIDAGLSAYAAPLGFIEGGAATFAGAIPRSARSFAPTPPAYDPHYHFQLAIDAGLSAYAAPLGFIEGGAATFAGAIP